MYIQRFYIVLFSLALISVGLTSDVSATASSPLWGAAWDDLRRPVTSLLIGASNPPSWIQHNDDGAGSAGTLVLEFSDETGVNEEQVWSDYQFPHPWREGSTVYPHMHWNLEDTTDCNVRWCWEYERSALGGSWPANTSTQCADCPSGSSTDPQHCDIWSSGLSMTGYGISTVLKVRIYRNSSHANDTCDSKDALLHDSDIHYQRDRPGSRFESTK
jgi:hypothetical protein